MSGERAAGRALSRRTVLGAAGAVGALGIAAFAARPARAEARISKIGVGAMPDPVAVDSATGMVYVGAEDGSVAVVDGRMGTRRALVDVCSTVSDVAVNDKTGRVYVADKDAGTITVLDGEDGRVITTVETHEGATALAVDQTTDTVYSGSATDGAITVFDGESNTVSKVVTARHGAVYRTYVDAQRRLAYLTVPSWPGLAVFELDSATLRPEHVKFGDAPAGVTMLTDSNTLYVANSGIHHVSVVNPELQVETKQILQRSAASSVAAHEESRSVYSNGGPDGLVRINGATNAIEGELDLAINPGSVAVDQNTGDVYVTDPTHDQVLRVSGF